MEKALIKVEGMSCEHCVKAVTDAVSALPGIAGVLVDLEGGTASVDYDAAVVDMTKITTAIEDEGYEVVA